MSQRHIISGRRSALIWLSIVIGLVLVIALAVIILFVYPEYQRQQQAEQHYQAGVAFQDVGDWDKAVEAFEKVVAIDATHGDARSRLAEVKTRQQEALAQAQARAEATAATATVEARTAQATSAAATATAQARATAQAQEARATATAEALKQLEVHYQKGLGYMNLSRWEEAKAELEQVFEVDPNYKEVQAKLVEVQAEIAKLTLTVTSMPMATPTRKPTEVADYSLLDDLLNLTVTAGQGQRFQRFQDPAQLGWHLDPWGVVADAHMLCKVRKLWEPDCTVGGTYALGQVFVHPVSDHVATVVTRAFPSLAYDTLTIAYAMADPSVSCSNGVQILVALINENGHSVVLVPPTKVVSNRWARQTINISSYVGQRVSLRLEADAIGQDTCDWLQIQLTLSRKNQ